jgi:micrococcal nuclease
MLYEYVGRVTNVYDGDTFTIDIDLGFGIVLTGQKIRLRGVNTPEVRGEERDRGLIARDFVRDQILGKKVVIHTYKDKKGKYGRWIADILIGSEHEGAESLSEILVSKGMAKVVNYN